MPEEFAPPSEKEEEPDSDLLEPDEALGGEDWEAEDHPRWHDYYMTVDVCERGVWVPVGYRTKAARLLMRALEKYPRWDKEDEDDGG